MRPLRQDLRCTAAVSDEEEAQAKEEEEKEEAEAEGDGVGDSRVRFAPAEEAGARPSASSPPPRGDGACVDDIDAGAAAARFVME